MSSNNPAQCATPIPTTSTSMPDSERVRTFKMDRLGTNGHPSARPSRMTYMAHGKGYVMCRHPGCNPFAVSEKDWERFPLWTATKDGGA